MVTGPTVDFGKSVARVVMKFLFLQGKGAVEIHGKRKEILKDGCLSYSTMKIWVLSFQADRFEVADELRSGWPASEATEEDKADAVHVMILEDRQISAKVIAETLGISRKSVGHIIHNILDMRKLMRNGCRNS
ncbi:Hypothetical predicted protein [Octopus vulgaris]|uniref:Protein GVQW3-like n=1 Tax=Octopus vulgaris TaxID=6645 RepID=A0AA36B839_OCTVU|nr:Hypothetical predicted protein [Octopus vulgaris]